MKKVTFASRFVLSYVGRFLTSAAIGVMLHSSLSAGELDHWQWRNPLPPANSLGGVAYGNGLFVAVGYGGTIQTSTDGNNWVVLGRMISTTLNRVVFANGLFVAVGNKGVIYTSSNGSTWTPRQSGTGTNLLSLVYGNSTFVAGGAGGTVVTSGDGTQWLVSNTGLENDLDWSAFGNGKFILPMPQSTGGFWEWQAKVLVSSNGVVWTPLTITPSGGKVYHIVFANGQFLAFVFKGGLFPYMQFFYSSPDAITWAQQSSAPIYHQNLFSLNGQFAEVLLADVGNSNQSVRFSSNGLTWTPPVDLPLEHRVTSPDPYNPVLSDAIFADGKYVLVGSQRSYSGVAITSTNGSDWELIAGGASNLAHLAFGNEKIVAVGSAIPSPGSATLKGGPAPILVSTNGISFAPAPLASIQALACVSFNGTNFVAVGRSGALQRSTNGTHWIVRPSGTSSDLASVCYGTNLWVAVGVGGTIVTSPDGLVWTLRTSGTSLNLYGVAFHDGRFVTVGEQGTVLTSPDGINWTGQFADTLNALLRIAWGNGRFVAVGAAGTVLTSSDGQTWTIQTPPTTNSLYGLSYGNGQFLAAGVIPTLIFGSVDNLNELLHSYDGVTWSSVPSPSYHTYMASAFGANTFWVAGDRGSILESDAVTGQPALSAGFTAGLFQLTVKGMSGQTFRIQACTNLSGDVWSDKALISNSLPIENWTDPDSTNSAVRFYRTVSP